MHTPLRVQCLMSTFLATLFWAASCFSPAYGADIYRWVDENGRIHYSDAAPHRSRKSVTRMDSRQYELTPEQRKEAEARAARDRAASVNVPERKAEAAPSVAPANPPENHASAKPEAPASDCDTLLQRFWESYECFAPFMNVNGSYKPNAFETCGPAVPYPARECS